MTAVRPPYSPPADAPAASAPARRRISQFARQRVPKTVRVSYPRSHMEGERRRYGAPRWAEPWVVCGIFAVASFAAVAVLAYVAAALPGRADATGAARVHAAADRRPERTTQVRAPNSRASCRRKSRQRRCLQPPKGAQRPGRSVDQQGGQELTPRDVVNGGGLGGGPDQARAGAIAWAKTQLRKADWAYRCERFVEEAYGTRFQYRTAVQAARKLPLHTEPADRAPRGALLFFRGDRVNLGYGHVGLAL